MSSSDDDRSANDGHGGSEIVSPVAGASDGDPSTDVGFYRRFMDAEDGLLMIVREMLSSAAMVAVVGLVLFAVSGVWPPMVAVESGSMEPHMERGDLVFIMDEDRLIPDIAYDTTGVVTYQDGSQADYRSFGEYGDVIIYAPNGGKSTPIIHRARFWVNAGENWYDKADPAFVHSDNCAETPNCPAPHSGFITKGDANSYYDQVSGISRPVKPSWITGTAELKIPWLGWIRLQFAALGTMGTTPLIGA